MADDKTFTKADLDKAIADAVAKVQESVDKLESKNEELVGDLRKARAEARKAKDIDPAEVDRLESELDKARADLADRDKQIKTLTTERDKAVKSLETEQGAARSYALDAEIAAGIAEGGVAPAYVPAYRAFLKEQGAEVEIADGKFVAKLGGKPAREFIKEHLAGDEGKAFKAAAVNGGGGAPGGKGGGGSAKTMTRSAYNALDQHAKAEAGAQAAKGELQIVDEAA